MEKEGQPAFMVYNFIKPYYPSGVEGVVFVDLVFNIPSDDGGEGLSCYDAQVDKAIENLKGYAVTPFVFKISYVLSRYTRFLVFLTTHSTPDDGLLWNVPDAKGAVSVSEVSSFTVLFLGLLLTPL
jgi:hypothetical protein